MIKKLGLILLFFIPCVLMVTVRSMALTPEELKEMLARGEKVTIIDIRHSGLYTQGHIPGAINIPSSIMALKRLPPIGDVVVCGDGIRTDLAMEAVDELNNKPGIKAEMLEGGFAAWEALNLSTTQEPGLGKQRFQYVTYQDLEKAAVSNPDMVLVDLRTRGLNEDSAPGSPEDLTDLSAKFPNRPIIRPERRRGSDGEQWDVSSGILRGRRGSQHRYQYVIIDNGDGQGEKVAQRLFAAGVKRVVILTGGEQILRRDGQPGRLKREKTQRLQEDRLLND